MRLTDDVFLSRCHFHLVGHPGARDTPAMGRGSAALSGCRAAGVRAARVALIIAAVLAGLWPARASAEQTRVTTLCATPTEQRLQVISPAARKAASAIDSGRGAALWTMFVSLSREGDAALIHWALELQSVVRARQGNYLHALYWALKNRRAVQADAFAKTLIERGIAVGPDSGHYENLQHLDPSAVAPSLPERVGATPIGFWVDTFALAQYDISYRPDKRGQLSRLLQITYRDGTRLDIDIRLISDNVDPAQNQSLGRMYLGPGKRLYPLRMDRLSTPNLWAAKRAALAEMARSNQEFQTFVRVSTSATLDILPLSLATRVQRPAASTAERPAAKTQARSSASETVGFGRNTVGAAERPIPRFTKEMKSRSRVIAERGNIDKVDELVAKFGGKAKKWRKMKTWTADGSEIHWYEHPGIGKVGMKWNGFPDPF